MAADLDLLYQWHYRPKQPTWPAWFGAWPGNARMAVLLIMLHEWESNPRPQRPMPAGSHHTFDFLALGTREYGMRSGVWRLLDVLEKHQVKVSAMVSGLVCELFPETVLEIKRQGHEVGTHGWDQSFHPPVFKSKDEEREALQKALAALENLSGEKTLGYMSQGPRPSPNTIELCAEAGFTWTCDYSDSDVPYVINVAGSKLVSVGYVQPGYTDNDLARMGSAAGLEELKATFDLLYAESAHHPMRLCYVIHSHVSGKPVMADLLDRFLTYAQSRPNVWFCRGIDLANFWLEYDA